MLQLLSSSYDDKMVVVDKVNVDPLIKNINILLTIFEPEAALSSPSDASVNSKSTSPPGMIGSDVIDVALEYISLTDASSLELILARAFGLVIGSPSGSPYNSSLSIM